MSATPPRPIPQSPAPLLLRALDHLAEAGYLAEADSARALCEGARWPYTRDRGAVLPPPRPIVHVPALIRALHHLAEGGYAAEADSAFVLCRATQWCEPVARGARHLDFWCGRSRLEYNVRVGCRQRMGWLVDRGGVEARVWDEEGGAPRWKLALFDTPASRPRHWPVWPVSAAHAPALQMLISKVGGAPHKGFVMPPSTGPPDFGFGPPIVGFGPPIVGPLAAWRAANPDALVANVRRRNDLVDADFVHLAGIKALNMMSCTNPSLTDAVFVHLRGLHTLWMPYCNQASITDAAFVHLHGLHTLWMYFCDQPTITDIAFTHLRGIQDLRISGCTQTTITGATFAHLHGVRVLIMSSCPPDAIAAARALGLPVEE